MSCVLWQGAVKGGGYGSLWEEGRWWSSHRWIYTQVHGELKPGEVVRHTCDQKLCINPDHLVVGTQQDNVDDMWRRGRGKSGTQHSNSPLSEDDVRTIRSLYAAGGIFQKELAARYGISQSAVSLLVNGKHYKGIST